jgi:RNA polymerase sigma-70 factor, ECF subfamily
MMQINQRLLDEGASGLAELFEHERAQLRRFLERRINRKLASRLDASDVIQEVFLRAQQAIAGYASNPVIPPVIWLRHLSKQVLCELHRKQFREIRSPYREEHQLDEILVMSLTNSSISVHSKLERTDLQSRIRTMLLELNVIDREVLEMRHVDGHSLTEIATMLNIQFETIKKRYYRALKRLKDLLDPPTA